MFDKLFTLVDLLTACGLGILFTALGVHWGLRRRWELRQARQPRPFPTQEQPGRYREEIHGHEMLMTGFGLGIGECCTAQLDGLQILSICDPDTNASKVVLPMKAALSLSRGMLLACDSHLRHNSGEEFNQQLSLACDHIAAAEELFQA